MAGCVVRRLRRAPRTEVFGGGADGMEVGLSTYLRRLASSRFRAQGAERVLVLRCGFFAIARLRLESDNLTLILVALLLRKRAIPDVLKDVSWCV